MHRPRLLWQLYPSYLLITLVSLLAVTFYTSQVIWTFHLEQAKHELESRALLIRPQFIQRLIAGEPELVDQLCKELGKSAATRITVVQPSGVVVGDSEESPAKMDNHADRPEIIQALTEGKGDSVRFSHTLGHEMAYVAIPLRHQGQVVGVLRTAFPLTSVNQALTAIYVRIAVCGLVVTLLAAGVSLFVSQRISRPIEEIKRAAERFAQGDLAHKLPLVHSQEISGLRDTMNQMAGELDEKIRTLLEERNEREAILSSMVEAVLAVDSERRVLRVNRSAAGLFGGDTEQLEGRRLEEVVDSPQLLQLVDAVFADRESAADQVVLSRAENRVLHAQGTVLIGPRDEIAGVLVVLHDVTRIQKLENVRRDFVANVSHELKTPITSIKGYVETLLDGAMNDPHDARRFLEIVASQSDRLNAIIDDLLTLSRMEQEIERVEISLKQGRIRPVLEASIAVSQLKASQNKIQIELDCDEQLETRINAPLLEQAVTDLIVNACKYSPAGASVWVEAGQTDDEVVIRVRDRGCGIEQQHLSRIFERFYRADKARSRELGGTGLGLAIVKHIAQVHGGRATVESVPGQGSTFSICLPSK